VEKVPRSEIRQRIERLQSLLLSRGLSGALIFQNVDLYYYTGTIQSSVLFVPGKGDAVLMVQKNWTRARAETSLETVVPLPKGRRSMADVLRDCGFEPKGKVGIELDVIPADLYLWLCTRFERCAWEDLSPLIRLQRMRKSPYEVERIRMAAGILDKGFRALCGIIREGMTELEVDGHMALIARRLGHMGILRMRGWNQEMTYAHVLSGESGAMSSFLNSAHAGKGTTPAMAQGAGFRRLRRNEPIGIDYAIGVDGYVGDQFRTFVIGALPGPLQAAHDCSFEIHLRFQETAGPGVHCDALYAMALKEAERAGLQAHFMGYGEGQVHFIGHGIGLEIDEFPIVAPGFRKPLEPGMVLALEPKFVFPGEGLVGLEDDYLVTPNGVERITLTDQTVMKVLCD